MGKITNKYKVTLESVYSAKAFQGSPEKLELLIENHDELFEIIRKIRQKDPFNNQEDAAQFALGLKIFSEIMIKNRNNPLFEELLPAFKPFMQKLKSN